MVVIFILTAPLLASSIRLESAAGRRPGAAGTQPRAITLSLDRTGQVFLNDAAVPADALGARLAEAAAQAGPGAEVQLRADTPCPMAGWSR